jgi:hypothetical protein
MEIYKKIPAIMRDVPVITKDRKTTYGDTYKFRGIDDTYNALHDVFAKHGVFYMPELINASREERQSKKGGLLIWSILDMKYTFFAEDGSSVSCIVRGEAMDSSDKATNKAMSIALKYALMEIFLIPTDDHKDPENDNPEPVKTTKPTLTKSHKHYYQIIDKLVNKEVTISQVNDNYIVAPEIKNELLEASKL